MAGSAATAESRLRIEDLIFSRTDERGVIQSFNDAFQYVSAYSHEKLIGAPHKIVRHDAMPKGVFYLLWETVKAGEPMGAYVQNMARGRHVLLGLFDDPAARGWLHLAAAETERDVFQADHSALCRGACGGTVGQAHAAGQRGEDRGGGAGDGLCRQR
jgi:hypothetical protein